MTTRRWKLEGTLIDSDSSATITIGGTQVFSGVLADNTQTDDPQNFVASGTYEVDDSTDSSHQFSITVSSGQLLVGRLFWDWGYRWNPDLTTEEAAYHFTTDQTQIPQNIKDSVVSKGGWGAQTQDIFCINPGHATGLTSMLNQDPRVDVKIDGQSVDFDINSLIVLNATETMTFTAGVPAGPPAR